MNNKQKATIPVSADSTLASQKLSATEAVKYLPKVPDQVLAIDPGTREMGVCILEGHRLAYHQVINLKKHRPESELVFATRNSLTQLLGSYDNIKQVVLEKVPPRLPAPFALLLAQVRAIKRWARVHKLPLMEVAAQTVRKHLVSNGRATKREAAKIVVSRYPGLRILLTQDYKYKEKYWQNMFDAIALGLTYQEQYAGV